MPPRSPIDRITHFITPSLGYAILRTSRPFAVNRDLLQRITHNKGTPPITSLEHVNATTFEEIHFDRWDLPHRNGTRLRRRNGSWEIVRRVSNARVGNQRERLLKDLSNLYEITGPVSAAEIDVRVKKGGTPQEHYDEQSEWNYQQQQLEYGSRTEAYVSLPSLDQVTGYPVSFGLDVIARFQTQRQKWQVDDWKFELFIDETDFGHLVGW